MMSPLHKIAKEVFSRNARYRARVSSILRLYTLLGVLIAAISSTYFLASKFKISISEGDQWVLALATSGVFIAVFSRIALAFIKEEGRVEALSAYAGGSSFEFLDAWVDFEDAASRRLGIGTARRPTSPSFLIRRLEETQSITSEDTDNLIRALIMRNRIAHARSSVFEESTESHLAQLKEITRRVRELPVLSHIATPADDGRADVP